MTGPWRSIETAPNDGTRILVYCPDGKVWRNGEYIIETYAGVYEVRYWRLWYNEPVAGYMLANCDEEYGLYLYATHWMPMPDGPD